MKKSRIQSAFCITIVSVLLAAALPLINPAVSMAFLQTEDMKAVPDLMKQSNISGVDKMVKQIDHIISATESGTYADNGWQLLKEDRTGTVRTIRAIDFQMWSATAELCREYGYEEAQAVFYYDNPDISDEEISHYGPICVDAEIDGISYKYYFAENKLIRRIGPEGTQNNPVTNTFLNNLYKLGVEYKKPGIIVKVGTFELVITSRDQIHKTGKSFRIEDSRTDGGYYIIDSSTKIAMSENNEPYIEDYVRGDTGYTWFERIYSGKASLSPAGVYLVSPSGNHIDIIYDTYWWD